VPDAINEIVTVLFSAAEGTLAAVAESARHTKQGESRASAQRFNNMVCPETANE
jgi:hypothetical protein